MTRCTDYRAKRKMDELSAVPWPEHLENWRVTLPIDREYYGMFRSEAHDEDHWPCASDPQHRYGRRFKRSMSGRIR